MKRLTLLILFLCLLFAANASAKVLFVVNSSTYYSSGYLQNLIKSYIADVNKIDHKDTSVVLYDYINQYTGNMHDRCFTLWQLLRDSCQANINTEHPIEGVVLIGNLPSAWCSDNLATQSWGMEIVPDDRYFMDLYNATTIPPTFYTNANESAIWTFSTVDNYFTDYTNTITDKTMDIWVSRIMAQQIRCARGPYYGWQYFEDENAVLIDYFLRVRGRMRAPAKVPARGFAMGAITEWPDHDPVTKLGMRNLNLQQLFRFDLMESSPGNYTLQLMRGPRGGTTLGAYNGERYADIGRNNITKIYTTLQNVKSSYPGTAVAITAQDTTGYEWAGLYEHSQPFGSNFNNHSIYYPALKRSIGMMANGFFGGITYGKQWTDANWLQPTGGLNNGSYYKYNTDYENIYNTTDNARLQCAIFKARITVAGDYTVWMYSTASAANTPNVWGLIASVPVNHDFSTGGGGALADFGGISQRPGGWIQIGTAAYHFNVNDTAWIEMSVDGNPQQGDFIVDAVRLVPTTGTTIIIDNADVGASNTRFVSTDWINRYFLDMQDEDALNHASYSKVPFFINSGCGVGDYYACYDPTDVTNNTLKMQIGNNLALLYGMTHGGLISFTSACSYPGGIGGNWEWQSFTGTIADQSKNFGDGSRAAANAFIDIPYVLIGAGTLKASAYIPYGTTMQTLTGITVSTTGQLYNYPGQLIWMENFTVTTTGGCTVQGNEVRVYAESDLKGEVVLKSGI